jgi:hypothetical protein
MKLPRCSCFSLWLFPVLLLGGLLCGFVQPLRATGGGDFFTAWDALPTRYKSQVLRVSADSGTPDPPAWFFTARNPDRRNAVHSITVVNGRVTRDTPSLDLRTIFREPSPLHISRVSVDSTGAWDATRRFLEGRGQRLGSVSYVLEQSGSGADPVWQIWAYDPGGYYIAYLRILATTGAIIEGR